MSGVVVVGAYKVVLDFVPAVLLLRVAVEDGDSEVDVVNKALVELVGGTSVHVTPGP